MTNLAKRLDVHFAACAAAGVAALGGAEKAHATIIYSGVQNLVVPNDFSGVYVDLVTHQTASSTFASFDTNPFYGAGLIYAGSNGTMDDPTGNVLNLAPGAPIGPPTSQFFTGTSNAQVNFTPGQPGIYGVAFFNEGNANLLTYGWVRIIIGAPPYPGGSPGTIVDWAYEDTGGSIPAGAVPAPGCVALLAMGAIGLAGRRRR